MRLKAEIAAVESRTTEQLFALIGGLVVLWAYVEHQIDAWVEIMHRTGGAEHIQPFLPPSLDRELDYLAVAWDKLCVPVPCKDEGLRLMREIHRLKGFRHNFVHGLIDRNDPDILLVNLWRVKKGERLEVKTPYSHKRLLANVTDCAKLLEALQAFVLPLAEARVEQIKKGLC